MKILHIINSLNMGGAEKLLVDSLPIYSEYGVDVDLLLLNKGETPFLKELECKFSGSIYFSSVNKYYSLIQILEIKKYMLKDYDVIHVHLFPAMYWSSIARYIFGFSGKLVFTEHSTHNIRLQNLLFRQIDKIIYRKYDKVTAITPQVKEVLINKLKLNCEKIEVVYNGIDLTKYKNIQAYPKIDFFNENDIILIQVSRFSVQKDQNTLIKALFLLPEKYKLLLVGDGENKKKCEYLVKKLSLENRVKFLGERQDVCRLLKTSDIIVQSSNWEGFGLSVVEGMATGKPVVVSDVPGLGDLVKDFGLLFEKGNENDLKLRILSLENEDFYNEIALKCKKRASNFDIHNMVENMINLVYKDNEKSCSFK